MLRRLLAPIALLIAALALPAAAQADSQASIGTTQAVVTATGATLENSQIARTWSFDSSGAVHSTGLVDRRGQDTQLAATGTDFQMTIDEVPTDSATGWQLGSAVAQSAPIDDSRPDAGPAVQLVLTYRLVPASGVGPELVRTFTLHPGSSVIEIDNKLVNP